MDKDKIEMKAVMETAAVADYLEALARGFKKGQITVEKGGESLTLIPVETAEVEVEARVKKDKARFSLEVTWRVAREQDDPTALRISAEASVGAGKDGPAKALEKKDRKEEDKTSDAKPAAKPEAKPAAKPAAKPEAKPEEKNAAIPAAIPSSGPAVSPASGPATKPAPKA